MLSPVRVLVLVAALLLVPGASEAADPIAVDVTCPVTIASAGGPLTISLNLRNRTAQTRNIAKSAIGVHLGNLNLLGPFIVPLARTLAPRATSVVNPYLATQFPGGAAPAGTLASVGVVVMDAANKPIGTGHCLVQVL